MKYRLPVALGGPGYRRVTAAEIKEWKRLRKQGMTYTGIGTLYGRNPCVVRFNLDPVQRAQHTLWNTTMRPHRIQMQVLDTRDRVAAGLCRTAGCTRPRATAWDCQFHRDGTNARRRRNYHGSSKVQAKVTGVVVTA